MDGTMRPKIGVGVIIVRDGKVLLGERLSSHGAGTLMIPGGHVEFGETFEVCAMREAKEECGLESFEVKGLVSVSNDIVYDKHFVSIGMLLESKEGEPFDAEPGKSTNWKWYDPRQLPENIFLPSRRVLQNWLEGKVYRSEW